MVPRGPPPANNVASEPLAISWTSVWWATTGNWWHSVVGHRSPTITLLSGYCVKNALTTGVTVSDHPPIQVTPGGNLKLVSSYPL